MYKRILQAIGVLGLTTTLAGYASAANFPASSQPIKIVVPYTAGGSSDFVARALAAKMSENMGHTVMVDNRPGGSTVIAADAVAKSRPDGHTILLLGELTHASLSSLRKDLPFDPLKSFTPITNIVESPLVISVHPSVPANNLQEFIEYAKAHPGEVNYGSAGIGNTLHLAGEFWSTVTGVEMTHVPYKGASQAIVDLVAGRIQVMFDLPQTPLPLVQEGKLRALAVTSDKRLDFFPDVPTTAEAGVPEYRFVTRIGLAAPANTPDDVIQVLYTEAVKALQDPDVAKSLADRAMFVRTSESQADFVKSLSSGIDMVTKILTDAGVQPE
ncbi:Bug family tripartite tricarboxylate transporter substrate binding protein [Allopusillimonas ginsengisoli]|uniref:Bug family tripartite tricarboxylate transporter substrate binding protein n=1 Tax=Allopusillimonas ginsengisoli TaxID=453575 RepID=UPI001021D038|nr:tripartite tricarboxylate transporter substrate binding protein [Allopusillimonas ginsengisoli]TEA79176.1 tripartite tricarboxylate transporter substrate binding protein [Allopusillimonas ginsengisoli]